MILGTHIKQSLTLIATLVFLPPLAIAQNTDPATAKQPETSSVQYPPTSSEALNNELEPIPDPYRGYLIELIVFKNTQHIELGAQDNNDYSLPNDRPTDRANIYPSISDELASHMERLELNTLYQPIAYTAWRQVSQPRSGTPIFQLNEIAPSLTGTVMVYDNVILLSELEVEYNPALGSAATDIRILDIPAQPSDSIDELLANDNIPEPSAASLANSDNVSIGGQNAFDTGLTDQAGNPALSSESIPYTGEYFPKPLIAAQSYIYRRVNQESARYLINEKRRIKFEETHYFDHPAFGILLRVIRTEIPVDEYNLSTVEALGIPPFSTPRSIQNDPTSFYNSDLTNTSEESP